MTFLTKTHGRGNNDVKLSKVLGSVSLCLGAAQLMAPGRINRGLGLGLPHWLLRLLGAREVVSGFAVLAHPDTAPPLGLRLAGDAMDVAILAPLLLPGRRSAKGAVVATAAVLGLTALDLAGTASLRRRREAALATARRTRYRQA